MHSDSRTLRLKQLERDLQSFRAARAVPRPEKGWIRAIREAAGVSAGELGRILGVSRQLPLQFEKAEAEDGITLKSLRNVANALDCDLVYALVPRAGAQREPTENRTRVPARQHAPAVKHSVALADRRPVQMSEAAEAEPRTFDGENQDPYFCD